ncbi:SIS domain-containing protein [Chelativorans sp. Marseille-P2723]|uniref:SIS domain-containing protein n=1 Tax=Chelativorans sp. Marseille-P2723 TaxID=2709133 RepID=UPI001570F95B|nr:SIS domain-containing protein [Chelativorans sp. Marseille-P2723]
MSNHPSLMFSETGEAAAAVARLFSREKQTLEEVGRLIAKGRPPFVTVSARGSSGHAASYFKYLLEIEAGIPVAAIGPSVASVYRARINLPGALHITISQSGASPDIVAMQEAAKRGGAVTVAVVNVTDSPVARGADIVLPIHAGEERSVAATKSFIASAAALAAFAQAATGSTSLAKGLKCLPEVLQEACKADFEAVLPTLRKSGSLYMAGRGPGFAIAAEAALKAKETARLHAEAFSLAELMHGPMQLVSEGFSVLAFLPDDEALSSNRAALDLLEKTGAQLAIFSSTGPAERKATVMVPSTGYGKLDPLPALAAYYRMIERLAREGGLDPDRPDKLKKVTETV